VEIEVKTSVQIFFPQFSVGQPDPLPESEQTVSQLTWHSPQLQAIQICL